MSPTRSFPTTVKPLNRCPAPVKRGSPEDTGNNRRELRRGRLRRRKQDRMRAELRRSHVRRSKTKKSASPDYSESGGFFGDLFERPGF